MFAFNAAKGNVRGSLDELRALKELTQLKDLKGNLHRASLSMQKLKILMASSAYMFSSRMWTVEIQKMHEGFFFLSPDPTGMIALCTSG
jgi:hypothetical protein